MAVAETGVILAAHRDIKAVRREHVFSLPAWAERRLLTILTDQRDLPVALLLTNICLTVPPAAVVVWYMRSHAFGAAFCACNYTLFLQRFLVALLHVTEHRALFKKDLQALGLLVPYLLAPLYGVPSGMYKLHHKVMHHVVSHVCEGRCTRLLRLVFLVYFQKPAFVAHQEGNRSGSDYSSTETYTRDSLPDFVRYWAKHAVGAWVTVPLYAWQKSRHHLLLECLAGELGYLSAVGLILYMNPIFGIWLLVVPFFLTSLAIMFGNWSQHIFVDTEEPQNVFRLAYNCIDCPDNQVTFNDGYHILHHLNSKTHWSDLPQRFLESLDKHDAEGALVFRGIGFFEVGMLVMCGRLKTLATHIVPCGPKQSGLTHEQLIQLLRERLKPLIKMKTKQNIH